MKIKSQIYGFACGVLFVGLVIGLVYPATAISSDQFHYNAVNLVVDGKLIARKNESYTMSNGAEIPYSILYNGTTYLPIRKVAETCNRSVDWNGNTATVIIGSSNCYSGTSYLTFDSVTGATLLYETDDFPKAYVYDHTENLVDYIVYLGTQGFELAETQESGNDLIMIYTNNEEVFGISWLSDTRVIVIPPQ